MMDVTDQGNYTFLKIHEGNRQYILKLDKIALFNLAANPVDMACTGSKLIDALEDRGARLNDYIDSDTGIEYGYQQFTPDGLIIEAISYDDGINVRALDESELIDLNSDRNRVFTLPEHLASYKLG